ncbi:RING finger protein Etp1 [Yamadazyma tenuis]|uniref:RING finger protein Etp1 n=1 Tax=Candida tenuis TaxID=2315449 RepID=UPI0027A68E78|nr:RING finger protein Etp1 [Yamadazyma tenuis]
MNSREPIKAKFLGEGIVRLYREFEDDSDSDDGPEEVKSTVVSNQGDDTMLSIISIPTYFTATDVLGFIGEKYMAYITHIRILKSEKPNRFLVLLKFNDLVKTAEFQYNFDGKPFNSMEPEACHVVYVKSVRIESPNSQDTKLVKSTNDALIPFLLNDPFTSPETKTSTDNTTLVELPTCPVCLERMDAEVTGLLTIPCQHTVWDYAGDNYVHRLITNQSDGKLVELPEKGSSSSDKPNSSIDKVDEVGFEYSQLLISQLASQQEYYEALLSEKNSGHAVGKSRRGSSITEIMNTKAITNLEIKVDELTEQLSQINLDVIPSLKDKIKLKDEKINRLSKDLNESKMFNETLSSKVEYLTSSKTELEAQNQDLNEQVKDLMFFLETQEKFKDEPQDVKDGTIVIQKDAKSKKGKKKR